MRHHLNSSNPSNQRGSNHHQQPFTSNQDFSIPKTKQQSHQLNAPNPPQPHIHQSQKPSDIPPQYQQHQHINLNAKMFKENNNTFDKENQNSNMDYTLDAKNLTHLDYQIALSKQVSQNQVTNSKSSQKKPPQMQRNYTTKPQNIINSNQAATHLISSPSDNSQSQSPFVSRPTSGYITQNQSIDNTHRYSQYAAGQPHQNLAQNINNSYQQSKSIQRQRLQANSNELGQRDLSRREKSLQNKYSNYTHRVNDESIGSHLQMLPNSHQTIQPIELHQPQIMSNGKENSSEIGKSRVIPQTGHMTAKHNRQKSFEDNKNYQTKDISYQNYFAGTQVINNGLHRANSQSRIPQDTNNTISQPSQYDYPYDNTIDSISNREFSRKQTQRDHSNASHVPNTNTSQIQGGHNRNVINMNTTVESIQNTINMIPTKDKSLITHQQYKSKIEASKDGRANVKKFVKYVIRQSIVELGEIDQIFKDNLQPYVLEGQTQFLENSEKHYRIKFVMDLVKALTKSIQLYVCDSKIKQKREQSQNINADEFRQQQLQIQKEKEKIKLKLRKQQEKDIELTRRLGDFEKVYKSFQEAKQSFDLEKQQHQQIILKYQREFERDFMSKLRTQKHSIDQEQMSLEDQRSRLIREQDKLKRQMDSQFKQLKLDQLKLQDDIQEFLALRDHFEHFRQTKMEQIQNMKQSIQDQNSARDQELNAREQRLKYWDESLKSKEQQLTAMLLRHDEGQQQFNESLFMKSCTLRSSCADFNAVGDDQNNQTQPMITNFFDQFLGQVRSNADEMQERERILAQFLNRNNPIRFSQNSGMNSTSQGLGLISLRGSFQATPIPSEMNKKSSNDKILVQSDEDKSKYSSSN
ncbi:UNKNOWN [Stylonychia lemnae]|uniref:Uncharacterized protein n=1 Tax=Stylonychia lemnae TaxID=5949 RepID=A0A078AHN1_STYLE|nr:UNKNOWN [Stylonychia lemnae]|eukprot:CDW81007.1 UNKNOWN [Stylonychia lemnae]